MSCVWYPINAYADIYYKDTTEDEKFEQRISDMAGNCEWEKLLKFLTEEDSNCISGYSISSRMSAKNEAPPTLYTPLHYAAKGKAPKEIFEGLLNLGASKCLQTIDGETAYDIAKKQELSQDILDLIKVPDEVTQNQNSIKTMEVTLHQLIRDRVDELIIKNGQQLPQLSLCFEQGLFHYEVQGWLGGFNVNKHEKGIRVDSLCRVWGGSEQNHIIEPDGTITRLPNDDPM